ncbi:DUF6544 family protein [Vaginisenegalia massiliensis]|uniref:DUF6544 family protein n=1 Tax=Vaginisenegalia massiliensis TaxID=2058294 RepID=UPI000F532B58|nr:DUF6544 family protein [Vaginisenegalia massiliensis]
MRWIKVLSGIMLIILAVLIWVFAFKSALVKEYEHDVAQFGLQSQPTNQDRIRPEDYQNLPTLIQNYLKQSGLINQPRMDAMDVRFKHVLFKMAPKQGQMWINYRIVSQVQDLNRLALIEGSLFGIPFNGYDYMSPDKAFMKGELANHVTLFNQTGSDLVIGERLTYLSEAFLMPPALLNSAIKFETLNNHQVKGTISYQDQDLSGIFSFNDQGQMVEFVTDQRPYMDAKGHVHQYKWKAECLDYQRDQEGRCLPTRFKASWLIDGHYFNYFNGKIDQVNYLYKP